MMDARQTQIFGRAVNAMATAMGRPVLFGPDNKPLMPSSSYGISRMAAKREGSMKNWVPKRLVSRQSESMERERIAERAVDLKNNDPHAAGIIDSFATTVIGAGLVPHPILNIQALEMSKDQVRGIQNQQKIIYSIWSPYADAGGRMSFSSIQFLAFTSLLTYGEYLILLPMLDDAERPYSLACQLINPLRLKTPVDLVLNPYLRDGIEYGSYGEPIAYWIKKSDPRGLMDLSADISTNFERIPAKRGHRWNVIHDFIATEPEQFRGVSPFASAMKFLRDLNDYLDAELVSNIVTAAFALFIQQEKGSNPYFAANNLSAFTETNLTREKTVETRYQEWIPGMIMYGNPGEEPKPIKGDRPGVTFDPFTKIVKKAIAMGFNVPYPVLFKDVEAVNFAGFRAAMLDAWRVFMHRRIWMGQGLCQKVWAMLHEEAYLRGDLKVAQFYSKRFFITQAEWRGSPKGDIEPIKAAQADVLLIGNKLKTRAESIAERGGDILTTFDQLEEEEEMLDERGLDKAVVTSPGGEPKEESGPKKEGGDNEPDEEPGSGEGLDQS